MKKIVFVLFSLLSASCVSQNKIDFGIKVGLNYNSNGKLYATNQYNELYYIIKSRGRVGYHFGVWFKEDIPTLPLYIQPEILYTHTKSTYIDFDRSDYTLNKIDIPILLGSKILKIGHVFAGPNFQFILDSDFDNISKVKTNSFSLALNIGVGIEIGKLGLDVRWERGVSKTKSMFLNDFISIDSRSTQLICGVKYRFSK